MSPYHLQLPTGAIRDVPRVTEVIRHGMPKPQLHEWEIREALKWAAPMEATEMDDAAATRVIASWRRDHSRHANRGTAVHKWIAAVLAGTTQPALLSSQSGYKASFVDWMVEHLGGDMRGALVEQTLTDARATVAGTADFVFDGHLYDWKTSEHDDPRLWPDQVAQLGAYALLTRLVDAGGHVGGAAPVVRRASIVRLFADGTHRTFTLAGDDLTEAISLWMAVRRVARATMQDRDRTDADTKEKSNA